MSTLLIEGGRRLVGRVDVEGNKNAALPLLAACLLTDEECVLHQRAAHRRRRGDGAAAASTSAPRSRASARTTLRVRCRDGRARTSPTARWSAGCAARCCCSGRCWRAGAARVSRRRAATFRRGARSRRTSRRSRRWARASLDGPGHRARGARRAEAGVDLSRRGVGHRHRDGAARGRGARRACPRSATPPASRTSSSCASSCGRWASASPAPARTTIRVEGGAHAARRRRTGCGATTSRPAAGRSSRAVTGGEIEVARRARRGHRGRRRRAASG